MIKLLKLLLLPFVSATIIAGFLWIPPALNFRSPELARIVVFHVPCSIVAMIASAVATWHAIRYLWKRSLIDDIKAQGSFTFALLLWILTTVTGAIFARSQWGAYWSWDIKQAAILILLMIFSAYFALRAAMDDERKRAALGSVYILFALLAVPYLTLGLPNSTNDTLHPKGTLTTKDGLDPRYAIVLWGGVIALTAVYAWAANLAGSIGALEFARRQRLGSTAAQASTVTIVEKVH